jgi:dienelactone hydrolase
MARSKRFRTMLVILMTLALLQVSALYAQTIERTIYKPPKDNGPVVIVISGQTGPEARKDFAKRVANLGYYVVLVDGNDILDKARQGRKHLTEVLSTALSSPNATSKKAFVIGFSQGGGGVLAHAMFLGDQVNAAVAIYPATFWIQNVPAHVDRFQLPLLILAAEKDTYKECCLISKAREIEAAAKEKNKAFEMVTYPSADHGFDLPGRLYRAADANDAWERVTTMLKRVHPTE